MNFSVAFNPSFSVTLCSLFFLGGEGLCPTPRILTASRHPIETEFLRTRGKQRVIKLPILRGLQQQALCLWWVNLLTLKGQWGFCLLPTVFGNLIFTLRTSLCDLPGRHRNAIVSSRNSPLLGFSLFTKPPLRP